MNSFPRMPLRAARILAVLVAAGLMVIGVAACGSSSDSSSSSAGSDGGSTTEGGSTTASDETEGGGGALAYPVEPTSSKFLNYVKEYGPPGGVKPTKEPYKVALLSPGSNDPVQESIVDGFEEGAKTLGIDLTVFSSGGFANVAKQVNQFETAIGDHPDAIVVIPTSPVALNAQIAKAKSEGIDVLASLIPPESSDIAYSLAAPVVEEGELTTRGLVKAIGEQGEIYEILGGAGSATNTLFREGAEKELAKYPDVNVVVEKNVPEFSPVESQDVIENGLASHPTIDGVLTNSTAFNSGIARGLQAAGSDQTPATAGLGPVTAAEIGELREGSLSVGVDSPFYSIGGVTLEWVLAIAEGKKPPAPVTVMKTALFTPDNIEEAIQSHALFQSLSPKALGCGPGQSEEC